MHGNRLQVETFIFRFFPHLNFTVRYYTEQICGAYGEILCRIIDVHKYWLLILCGKIHFCFIQQIDDSDIPRGERTFQLLCHYFHKDHKLTHNEWLPDFTNSHIEWIEKVTKSYFHKTKKTLKHFLNYWLIPAFPLNEVGIMLLARFFTDMWLYLLTRNGGQHKLMVN